MQLQLYNALAETCSLAYLVYDVQRMMHVRECIKQSKQRAELGKSLPVWSFHRNSIVVAVSGLHCALWSVLSTVTSLSPSFKPYFPWPFCKSQPIGFRLDEPWPLRRHSPHQSLPCVIVNKCEVHVPQYVPLSSSSRQGCEQPCESRGWNRLQSRGKILRLSRDNRGIRGFTHTHAQTHIMLFACNIVAGL